MANKHSNLKSLFTDIATSIRNKTGSTDKITADDFPAAIDNISTGVDTSDATAVASDVLTDKTFYAGGEKKTGTMPIITIATPSISVSTSGLITSAVSQSAGYTSGGMESVTKQLTTQSAQTITPTTYNQTISEYLYLIGSQTILGDSNLQSSNIKSGVSIFGVNGSFVGGSDVDIQTISGINDSSLTVSVSQKANGFALICASNQQAIKNSNLGEDYDTLLAMYATQAAIDGNNDGMAYAVGNRTYSGSNVLRTVLFTKYWTSYYSSAKSNYDINILSTDSQISVMFTDDAAIFASDLKYTFIIW